MAKATTAPETPATRRATKKSWGFDAVASRPATSAPTPTSAHCPKETLPAQPVRITSEIPMIP